MTYVPPAVTTYQATPQIPPDVQRWLDDTYTAEGRRLWLLGYTYGDDEHRQRMIRFARTADGGT